MKKILLPAFFMAATVAGLAGQPNTAPLQENPDPLQEDRCIPARECVVPNSTNCDVTIFSTEDLNGECTNPVFYGKV